MKKMSNEVFVLDAETEKGKKEKILMEVENRSLAVFRTRTVPTMRWLRRFPDISFLAFLKQKPPISDINSFKYLSRPANSILTSLTAHADEISLDRTRNRLFCCSLILVISPGDSLP